MVFFICQWIFYDLDEISQIQKNLPTRGKANRQVRDRERNGMKLDYLTDFLRSLTRQTAPPRSRIHADGSGSEFVLPSVSISEPFAIEVNQRMLSLSE